MASDTDRAENGPGDGDAPPKRVERCNASSTSRRPSAPRGARRTRAEVPRASHGDWEPAAAPPGPGRAARGAGADARAGARADPLRPHARLAVHVLPRRRVPDGLRSRGRPAHGAPYPALRRRAPVELRRLRRPRPQARLQPQRLRRDASRPVRVGRQAARRELRGRRPGPRLRREAARRDQPRGRPLVPREHPRVRRDAQPRPLVLADRRRRSARRAFGRGAREGRQGPEAARGERRQGPDEGQHQGVRQADRRSSTGSCGSSATRR